MQSRELQRLSAGARLYGSDHFRQQSAAAVPGWIDTVFHRIPMLDPWTVDLGYGGATGCDVIDVGRGARLSRCQCGRGLPQWADQCAPGLLWIRGPARPLLPAAFRARIRSAAFTRRPQRHPARVTKDSGTSIDHLAARRELVRSAPVEGYFVDTAFMYGAPFALSTGIA